MDFLEKDLEGIIFEGMCDPYVWDEFMHRGMDIDYPYTAKHQFRIGNYGIADIVTLSHLNKIVIRVWELKQREINTNTLLQLVRYMKGIKVWLGKYRQGIYHKCKIEGVMMGRSFDKSGDFVFLSEFFEAGTVGVMGSICAFTYDYAYSGITFDRIELSDYVIRPGFDQDE